MELVSSATLASDQGRCAGTSALAARPRADGSLADVSSPLTVLCAWTYLAARILYIPAYIFGWVPWRSLIWMVGLLATAVLLLYAVL